MPVIRYLVPTLAVFAALTATFGNLAAYMQTNLKRLLAYSTIAHAGYMMMALAPLTADGIKAVLFYLVAYLFMNLGAFAIVAYLRNLTGSEDLADFRGLVAAPPWLVLTLFGIFLLSLLGMPPLVGFFAKFQIFQRALYDEGRSTTAVSERPGLSATLVSACWPSAASNTVLSAAIYQGHEGHDHREPMVPGRVEARGHARGRAIRVARPSRHRPRTGATDSSASATAVVAPSILPGPLDLYKPGRAWPASARCRASITWHCGPPAANPMASKGGVSRFDKADL